MVTVVSPVIPGVTPYTAPVVGLMVATDTFPLLHVPPSTALLKVIVAHLWHNPVTPVIGNCGLTVTVVVA
jgi:hypothetical protein